MRNVIMRWKNVERTVFHLQMARALRSVSQGIAVVDLTLYLKELDWSAAAIGGVLSAAGLTGAALILFVGIVSDRMGRKPFLLVYEIMTAIAALLLTFTSNVYILSSVIIITGFGRGQSGAAGPFTPAEQAWMTAHVPLENRGQVFSINSALGFFGMSLGALLAGTNHLWEGWLPGALSFRPLFLLMFFFSLACAAVIFTTPRESRISRPAPVRTGSREAAASDSTEGGDALAEERIVRRSENRSMIKLAAVNMLNGLAIGFMSPLMSYWFARKYGVTSAEIGVTLALSFVFTGISSIITGGLAQRYGMVKSVVWLRLISVGMVLILPLMPAFWLASLIYIARSALSRGTQGARSALSTSLTRDHRRGFSVSMNSLAVRLSSSVGPTASGYILDMGELSLPFYLTGGLQLISSLLYGKLFKSYDQPGGKRA